MEIFSLLIFWLGVFIIVNAMIGYPLVMRASDKILKPVKHKVDYRLQPTVTVVVPAHNEEKVIVKKMENFIELNYPKDKIKMIIASDNSSDSTNELVKDFIENNPYCNISLFEVQERKGRTNAQNKAQETVESEFLVLSDANSMLAENAVSELMASFVSDEIAYVCGRLQYTNDNDSKISDSESTYWNRDVSLRDIESRFQTITGGNGALYAIRNKDYLVFSANISHDTWMPLFYALDGRKAIMNVDALVYEKAGTSIEDEFSRKVRMNRRMLDRIMPDIRILNIFRYRWFTLFWIGHRSCRYLLWISHLLVLLSSIYLALNSQFFMIVLVLQLLFYFSGIVQMLLKINNRYLRMIYYYLMTISAQWVGFYKVITKQSKPFWDKAETTRD